MIKFRSSQFIAILLGLFLQVTLAQAQLARTHVSSENGNDANDCARLTPCRTFQAAHDKTLPAGEITVLDPGGYGAVTITKTISIINDGVGEAGLLVSGGLGGITINAGASDAVSLRGLTVKGIGFGGGNSVVFNSGKSLTIENCAIRNLDGTFPLGRGIAFVPTVSSSLAVSNTVIADNSFAGIDVRPSGTTLAVRATLNRVEFYGNGFAGFNGTGSGTTGGTIDATVVDSVSARANNFGFRLELFPGQTVGRLSIVRSVSANNGTGIVATGANATVRVGQSTVAGNTSGWTTTQGGILQSYGDNNVDGNAGDEGAMPVIAKK